MSRLIAPNLAATALRTVTCSVAALVVAVASPAVAASYSVHEYEKRPLAQRPAPPLDDQMRIFLPEWSGQATSIPNEEWVYVDEPPLDLASRGQLYPLVPLPPAMQSMAALAGCVLVTRGYRHLRRYLRRL